MSDKAIMGRANHSAEKQMERAKRQAILSRILESNEDLTFEEIAEKMRENQWVAARWPAYSATTANRDFSEVMLLVEDDIRAMAKPYLARNLDLMDEAIDTLRKFGNDDELPVKTRISALESMLKYFDQSNKVFGNYAAKEMHIKKAEVTMDLDTFRKVQEEARKQLDDVVDGELIEVNDK